MFAGLKEVIEVGMLQVLLAPSNLWLFIPSWLFVILGFFTQLFCLRKGKARWFAAFLAVALLVSESLCQIITGWDVLLFLILYGLFIYMLLGALIAFMAFWVKIKMKL